MASTADENTIPEVLDHPAAVGRDELTNHAIVAGNSPVRLVIADPRPQPGRPDDVGEKGDSENASH